MAEAITMRRWATPLTIGASVLMFGTGVMMFFDIVPGYVTFVHEWLSWLFVLGAGAHIAVNYRPFLRHLKSGWPAGNSSASSAMSCWSAAPGPARPISPWRSREPSSATAPGAASSMLWIS